MDIKYLYHASPNKDIDILKPRQESIRDPREGPVVFASQDKAYTSCFLVPTDNSWVKISKYTSNSHPDIHVICISDEAKFKKLDKGGAIYYLSPKDFYLNRNKSDIEWTSKTAVKPIKKEFYEKGLEAMIDHGVIVYFCSKDILQKLKKDPNDVRKTMRVLKKMQSENEKRGLDNLILRYY